MFKIYGFGHARIFCHDYWKLANGMTEQNPYARAMVWETLTEPYVFDKTPEFVVFFNMSGIVAGLNLWLVLSAGQENTTSNKKFGVRIEETTVYVISSDIASKTKTQVATGVAAGWHSARVKVWVTLDFSAGGTLLVCPWRRRLICPAVCTLRTFHSVCVTRE